MENYTLNTPNGMGHMVPVFSSPFEEETAKELAQFGAGHMLQHSAMPEQGHDFTVTPNDPLRLSGEVQIGIIRDLLNMDTETQRQEVPGRVGALYVALAKVFALADESDDPLLREIAGICAAAFGEVQNGHSWQRKDAKDVMLEKAQARIAELEAKLGRGW